MPILTVLADDPDPQVRWMVAMKRKAPASLLEKLARDQEPSVRQRVACNPKTPPYLLEVLAKDQEAFVAETARAHLAHTALEE